MSDRKKMFKSGEVQEEEQTLITQTERAAWTLGQIEEKMIKNKILCGEFDSQQSFK